MDRKRPSMQNKVEIPVKIFKGEELIPDCSCIQAAKFKNEINSRHFNWSAINKGIWYGESYSKDGATYFLQQIMKLLKL